MKQKTEPSAAEVNSLIALYNGQRYAEAESRIGALLGHYPDFAFGWKLLGGTLQMQGKDALPAFQKVAELMPDDAEAHFNLGVVRKSLGRLDQALTSYQRAIHLKPDYAEAHSNLGNTLKDLGLLNDAVASYRCAIKINPASAIAHNNLGTALKDIGNLGAAVESYRKAIAIKPDYVEAHSNLGNVLKCLGNLDAAAESCRKALEIKPDYAEAHNNLGLVFNELGQLNTALESFHRAISFKPDYAEAHSNLGNVFKAQFKLDAAVESYRKALSYKPDFAEAHNNLSLILLLRGEFREGWREYEWRIKSRAINTYISDPRNPSLVLPRPSALLPLELDDKRILLVPDQGLGDEIFFLRFAQTAQQRGAWTAYLPSAKIATIVQRSPGLNMVISGADIPPNLDHIFSVGDLPLILGMNRLDDIPPALPLTVLPDRLSAIKDRLAVIRSVPLLGVTWRAGTQKKVGGPSTLFRKTDVSLLGGVLSMWPGEVLILQRNPLQQEVEDFTRALGRPVHDFSELNDNLEDMLALLSQLDEYVGVHNTNMHLMAGLGKTARVLITHPPEWRDTMEGNESPWFPDFQLYREKPDGDWNAPLAQLTEDLLKGRAQ
jgi:tetratricopeptide (TPR) repeat protein